MNSTIISNDPTNGVLVEIGHTHATAKRINLPKKVIGLQRFTNRATQLDLTLASTKRLSLYVHQL